MGTVIVIGNGFDIDLGWHTSYRTFCDSRKRSWDILHTSEDGLYNYVIDKMGENWYDLELTIYQYCLNKSREDTPNNLEASDLDDFKSIKTELYNFLSLQCKKPITDKSCAYWLLKQYILKINQPELPEEEKPTLFSFNYTPLKKVAEFIMPNAPFHYYPIHGTLEENNCILGIPEDSKIKNGYVNIEKVMDDNFNPPPLVQALCKADKIIFFGVSMGTIDSIYYKDVLKDISTDHHNNVKILFVTWNNDSRKNIKKNLQKMDINTQLLMNSAKFLLTSENISDEELEL